MDQSKQTTRIGAYGVLRQDNQILLCHLSRSGMWTLPGGGIEFGEPPEKAMTREVLEETGLEVIALDLLGINSFTITKADENFHSIQIVYLADIMAGELRYEEQGTTDMCAWHPYRDVQVLDSVELVKFAVSMINWHGV
ncbi:MAG: NUDIX domain-containing protein [Chloroflexi bacterium]|nr:NUDIX domain-containing protein [Chloroflexota bacterium]